MNKLKNLLGIMLAILIMFNFIFPNLIYAADVTPGPTLPPGTTPAPTPAPEPTQPPVTGTTPTPEPAQDTPTPTPKPTPAPPATPTPYPVVTPVPSQEAKEYPTDSDSIRELLYDIETGKEPKINPTNLAAVIDACIRKDLVGQQDYNIDNPTSAYDPDWKYVTLDMPSGDALYEYLKPYFNIDAIGDSVFKQNVVYSWGKFYNSINPSNRKTIRDAVKDLVYNKIKDKTKEEQQNWIKYYREHWNEEAIRKKISNAIGTEQFDMEYCKPYITQGISNAETAAALDGGDDDGDDGEDGGSQSEIEALIKEKIDAYIEKHISDDSELQPTNSAKIDFLRDCIQKCEPGTYGFALLGIEIFGDKTDLAKWVQNKQEITVTDSSGSKVLFSPFEFGRAYLYERATEELQTYGGLDDESAAYDVANGITLNGVLSTIFGILTYIPKLLILVPGLIANSILSVIANVGGITDFKFITLEDILFNKVPVTDVNIIFNRTELPADATANQALLNNIGDGVSGWYYSLRNLALALSFLVLLIAGIRMVFDNYGPNRAKYKKILIDWVVSVAIIILMDYFIAAIIRINTMAVNMLRPGSIDGGESYMNSLLTYAFDISLIKSWGAAIMYSLLGIIGFIFLVIYIKRMLMTCFLVMIAPVVAIVNSFEKIGQGNSKILSTWVKEFCYNVLIQPFHCIVYIVFVGTAMNALYDSTDTINFKYMVIAVACTFCLFMGEKIIRTIFGFTKSKSVASKLFNAAMITSVINNVKQVSMATNRTNLEDADETPATMPNGEKTSVALAKEGNNKVTLKDTPVDTGGSKSSTGGAASTPFIGMSKSYARGTSTSSRSDTSKSESSGGSSKDTGSSSKAGRKRGMPEMGEIGASTDMTPITSEGTGRTAKNSKKQDELSRKEIEKMDTVQKFLVAAKYYRREVNPNMTNAQLALRTEQLRKTSMGQVSKSGNVAELQYKVWISSMEKTLASKGVARPDRFIYDLLKDNKEA